MVSPSSDQNMDRSPIHASFVWFIFLSTCSSCTLLFSPWSQYAHERDVSYSDGGIKKKKKIRNWINKKNIEKTKNKKNPGGWGGSVGWGGGVGEHLQCQLSDPITMSFSAGTGKPKTKHPQNLIIMAGAAYTGSYNKSAAMSMNQPCSVYAVQPKRKL